MGWIEDQSSTGKINRSMGWRGVRRNVGLLYGVTLACACSIGNIDGERVCIDRQLLPPLE
jgi:hypothetical protein